MVLNHTRPTSPCQDYKWLFWRTNNSTSPLHKKMSRQYDISGIWLCATMLVLLTQGMVLVEWIEPIRSAYIPLLIVCNVALLGLWFIDDSKHPGFVFLRDAPRFALTVLNVLFALTIAIFLVVRLATVVKSGNVQQTAHILQTFLATFVAFFSAISVWLQISYIFGQRFTVETPAHPQNTLVRQPSLPVELDQRTLDFLE